MAKLINSPHLIIKAKAKTIYGLKLRALCNE